MTKPLAYPEYCKNSLLASTFNSSGLLSYYFTLQDISSLGLLAYIRVFKIDLNNTVAYLKGKRFLWLTLAEKLTIKQKGRHCPDAKLKSSFSSKGKRYNRKFNRDLYEKHNWLTGCSDTNALLILIVFLVCYMEVNQFGPVLNLKI